MGQESLRPQLGDDAVFRMRNGAAKIMTKFKDKPYSYELLPEYANGSKKFPTVKSMNWLGRQERHG